MQNIKISVYCTAYNCVKYIEKSIKGMLNQDINVDYKIIIHDDASTDGTSDIVRKYAELYPGKIYAILQTENQYSKGVNIYKQYIEPHIKGDYIAICEGDDYWTDINKLQIQYDYMEKHPECSLCTHNTEKYDLKTNKKHKFNNWKDIHVLRANEVFYGWSVHLSSYLVRRTCESWPGKRYWFGDYIKLTWSFYCGQVVSLPKIMSVHNYNNPNGVMRGIHRSSIDKMVSGKRERAEYLEEYNSMTQYKFDSYVQKGIKLFNFESVVFECNDIILKSFSREEIIDAVRKVTSHEYYKEYKREKRVIKRVLTAYRFEGYVFYPLWKVIIKNYLKRK